MLFRSIKIQQVFVNLFVNAAHAMGEGGGRLVVRVFPDEAGMLVAEVRDTGPGIQPENLAKVFDPFFTTKPVGVGSGMGLAVARGIVEQHGGTLHLANHPDGGAVATVTFPTGKETADEDTTRVVGG